MIAQAIVPVLFMVVGVLLWALSPRARDIGLATYFSGALAFCEAFARHPVQF